MPERDPRCGTYAGVSAHNVAKEPLCDDCRRANADYSAWWRFRTGRLRMPRSCPRCGSVFFEHRCGAPDVAH
jgi:hypothetical protein